MNAADASNILPLRTVYAASVALRVSRLKPGRLAAHRPAAAVTV